MKKENQSCNNVILIVCFQNYFNGIEYAYMGA